MKKFYPIVRRKFQRVSIFIFLFIFVCPSISEATFSSYGTNSVTNGNAEAGDLSGWILTGSGFSSFASGTDPTPKDGTKVFDFYIGSNSSATLTQIISLSAISSDISAGKVKAVLTGSIVKLNDGTIGYILLEELNSGGSVLNSQQENCSNPGAWEDKTITIPLLNTATSQIRITLYGKVTGTGDYCDFDIINLSLYRWPVVTTSAASTITTNSAILGGNITIDGGPGVTERGVVYSTTNTNPTIGGANVTKVAIASGAGLFSQTISGLSGAQLYYFNTYAINTAGTVYGTPTSFTTLTPTYLTATTNNATSVTINSATLNGTVNANGRTTNAYFEYGTTTSYGTQVAASPATATGTSATTETVAVTGLLSSTTYHFRMAAYNTTELWKYGTDQTFTTLTPVSEIGLKQGSTAIADGGSYDFGFHQPSTNTDIIFTIENTGTGVLTLTTPLIIGGTNANQFSILSEPASTVAVSGSTTFTVRFTPTSIGNKTATISFANNDSNENPYDFTISGAGYLPATVTSNAANYYNRYPDGIVATGMTVNGSVNANNSSTAVTFEYGLTTSYGSTVTAIPSPVTGMSNTSVSYNLTGLTSNTLYHYRAVGTNLGGAIYGNDQTFTTPILANFIGETDEAKTFTEGGTSFSITGYLKISNSHNGYNGSVVDDYYASNNLNSLPAAGVLGSFKNLSNYFFANSIWVAPGLQDGAGFLTIGQYGDVIIRGKRSGTTLFTHTLLSSATNVSSFTFVNLSSYNTILIDELEFEVTNNIRYMSIDAFNFNYQPAFLPTVTTQAVSVIGTTTATSNGNITNLGSPNPTVSGICWNTSTNPTTANFKTTDGPTSSTGAYTGSLTSLTPGTLYYVKAYATNAAGTSYGNEVTFTTLTAGTWTGASSTAWNLASNWAGLAVPTSTTDVIIPDVANDPLISDATTANCRNLTITGSLTIQSSASGTGSLIVSGTSTGNVTCESYMTSGTWHMVSSPVSELASAFLSAPANTNIATKDVTSRGMKNYIESTDAWSSLFTDSNPGSMGGGTGSALWLSTSGTVSFTGALQTGNTDIAITRTPSTGYGWNLVGNPYTSAIAINNAAQATNNFINLNSGAMADSYIAIYYWNGSGYTTVPLNGGEAFYAQVGQGFFVKSKSGGGTISFTATTQTHQTGAAFKSAVIPLPEIKLVATLDNLSSNTIIRFDEDMKYGLDPGSDAGMMKSGFDLYTKLVEDNGVDFGVQCLPLATSNEMIIPIGLESSAQGLVSFSAQISNLPSEYLTTLEDRETGIFTPLEKSGRYTAQVAAKSKITGRFFLHTYSNSTTGITGLPEGWNIYTSNGQICISGSVTDHATASLYDLMGREIGTYKLQKGSLNYIPCSNFRNGIYLLNIKQAGKSFTRKIAVTN